MMDLLDQRVIGYEATKDILRQIFDILSHRSIYEARGAAIPHGLLMVSEPGLGKSLMAGAFFWRNPEETVPYSIKTQMEKASLTISGKLFVLSESQLPPYCFLRISTSMRILPPPTALNGLPCRAALMM